MEFFFTSLHTHFLLFPYTLPLPMQLRSQTLPTNQFRLLFTTDQLVQPHLLHISSSYHHRLPLPMENLPPEPNTTDSLTDERTVSLAKPLSQPQTFSDQKKKKCYRRLLLRTYLCPHTPPTVLTHRSPSKVSLLPHSPINTIFRYLSPHFFFYG